MQKRGLRAARRGRSAGIARRKRARALINFKRFRAGPLWCGRTGRGAAASQTQGRDSLGAHDPGDVFFDVFRPFSASRKGPTITRPTGRSGGTRPRFQHWARWYGTRGPCRRRGRPPWAPQKGMARFAQREPVPSDDTTARATCCDPVSGRKWSAARRTRGHAGPQRAERWPRTSRPMLCRKRCDLGAGRARKMRRGAAPRSQMRSFFVVLG